ncbi:bifunctional [glutamine synthetase] adenylyltransferase/[glutamine synthetase]-adenylyl-L-tyrosine phosphorylase [Pelagibius sp. Alg239-R121]|uniref:bifunctional [glutamine synthetase] adenylyltransferase/[glutamine synthetase]-adenylyl-L-tyrosine phosphorylase n=1 Tax=Pelagibius sp. Alg239-R121 TaxID=2993448 RepID=UPI0024A6647D|nr:bifunctional [glutamine synthetase] adenylyltransferase/[glutamine synthetase]-adenylyl-L-tyrosine phosphorylase [Pelagibius sp. Alg239-R121]
MQYLDQISKNQLPKPRNAERVALGQNLWTEQVERLEDPALKSLAEALPASDSGKPLLDAVFANSPFLTHALTSDIGTFFSVLTHGPSKVLSELLDGLKNDLSTTATLASLSEGLRVSRRRMALVTALADLCGFWNDKEVVEALSDFADASLSAAIGHLLRAAHQRGELQLPNPDEPEKDCGYVVLAMGKLGAGELNYSSDIDLVVLFDRDKVDYLHHRGPQEGYVRLTQELVRLLQDRTKDGYVFRTDLRLRPDPSATPLAISLQAALTYYESLGKNWERAAMIKARPCAGDLALGEMFLRELHPFVWRKHLDFAAIQEIHGIKRQINAHKGSDAIALLGHNVKLGRGGIREIEFFAQTQQMIWGGRDVRLRNAKTVATLKDLVETGHLDQEASEQLTTAYWFLRRVEHRLQMVDDQQTHNLPKDEEGLAEIGAFMGYDDSQAFRDDLLKQLRCVEEHYARLFEDDTAQKSDVSLIVTEGEPSEAVLETLENMGFSDGSKVFHLIRGWQHGRYRATRSPRAQRILGELLPSLLRALGETAQPDFALTKFDSFLGGLPAGVQLFSMLSANPTLLGLIAEIMGGAPVLADRLSQNSGLLDAVLTPGFFDPAPDVEVLEADLKATLGRARDFEDVLDLSRRWANDHRFQIGVHILRHTGDAQETGESLSNVADAIVRGLYHPVLEELAVRHGRLNGPDMAVISMGRLGAQEMTVSSDLDLLCLYDPPPDGTESDGARPLDPGVYFVRFTQRLINALTAPTGEGRLYEVDMRLRPSGNAGPVASSLSGFVKYQESSAWTWEHMALTRARVIIGDSALKGRFETAVRKILCQKRDPVKLLCDVAEMRERIERERRAKSPWDSKHFRGGLVDIEFLVQYLQLRHAADFPEILSPSSQTSFAKCSEAGILSAKDAGQLIATHRLLREIQGLLRLTVGDSFEEETASDDLKIALCRATGFEDFQSLKKAMIEQTDACYEIYQEIIGRPYAKLET